MNTYYSKDRKGATDSGQSLKDEITKSNLTFGRGGYFFVFLMISKINITMIFNIISMMDKI